MYTTHNSITPGKEDSVDIPPTVTTASHSSEKKGNLNVQVSNKTYREKCILYT